MTKAKYGIRASKLNCGDYFVIVRNDVEVDTEVLQCVEKDPNGAVIYTVRLHDKCTVHVSASFRVIKLKM